jgi:hypothetical protein
MAEHVERLWDGPLGMLYVDYVLADEHEAESLADGGLEAMLGGDWLDPLQFKPSGKTLFLRIRDGSAVGRGEGAGVPVTDPPPRG